MKIRNVIVVILCLCVTGCFSKFGALNSESEARNLMDHAAGLVDSSAYHQAAQEYAMVAERYPSTSYYKLAVWKAAFLNIYPANPEINYSSALYWFQVYLGLPLSPEEKETATVYVAMIEHINNLQAELSALGIEKDKLLAVTRKQSGDIQVVTQQQKELEAELASTQDELKKMKAVDVRMHQNRGTRIDGKPTESVQKASKPKTDKKRTKQARQNALAKDKDYYPYMIQVSSYPDKEESMREAMILRNKGDSVCVSHAHIAGRGDWYRVFVGVYRTPEEARKAVLELKKREYRNAFVVRRPFAIEVGIFSGDKELNKMEANLLAKGYSAYSAPNSLYKNKIRLLVGAFRTEKEAETAAKNLQKEGFKPKVVRR